MDMNYRGGMWEGGGRQDGVKCEGNGTSIIAQSINTFKRKIMLIYILHKL